MRVGRRQRRGWVHVPVPLTLDRPAAARQRRGLLPSTPLSIAPVNSLGRAQPQSPSRALTLDVLYQALEQRLTEIEEPFDTEAGLARLHEWMPAEQTESR